jgi:hypothetical protein
MGTQNSNLGDGQRPTNQPPEPEEDANDLGIPANAPQMTEDPAGFNPRGAATVLKGRRVLPVQDGELPEAHKMYAGRDTPMFGADSFKKRGPDEAPATSMPPPQARQEVQQDPAQAAAAAQRVMPPFLNPDAAPPPAAAPMAQQAQQQQQQQVPPPTDMSPEAIADAAQMADYRLTQTTAALEYLTREERAARERGDYLAAEQAQNMAQRLGEDFNIKRVPKGEGRHPAMAKLMANLGLEKIERQTVPWAGSDWTFAPTNSTLDLWVNSQVEDDGRNFPALLISAGLVGLDGVPIYDVLRVPLTATLVVTEKATGKQRKVDVAMYRRVCDCGHELHVTTEKCDNCGTVHDPFDIPMDLRASCAEAMLRFFENDFGAYEELAFLLEKKNEVMPDRAADKETLYPLAMPSPDPKTTTDSQSGDE